MSMSASRISTRILEADGSENMAKEYISVSEALKLVSPFSGNKKEVSTFISNVDTAFEVVNPDHRGRLYKFVLTRISGEPRTAIAHRHLQKLGRAKRIFEKHVYRKENARLPCDPAV